MLSCVHLGKKPGKRATKEHNFDIWFGGEEKGKISAGKN